MASSEFKWRKAAEKLLEMTKNGDVVWEVSNNIQRDDSTDFIYQATVNDRSVIIYEYNYQYYDPDTDTSSPATHVAIEFIDNVGTLEYRWPKTPSHWALLDAVKFKVSGAGDFLDDFLAGEE